MNKSLNSVNDKEKYNKIPIIKEILYMFKITFAIFITLSLISYSYFDPSLTHIVYKDDIKNLAGLFGAFISDILIFLLGYLSPYFLIIFIINSIIKSYKHIFYNKTIENNLLKWQVNIILCIIILISCSGIEAIFFYLFNIKLNHNNGGIIGSIILNNFSYFFKPLFGIIILLTILISSLSLYFQFSLFSIFNKINTFFNKNLILQELKTKVYNFYINIFKKIIQKKHVNTKDIKYLSNMDILYNKKTNNKLSNKKNIKECQNNKQYNFYLPKLSLLRNSRIKHKSFSDNEIQLISNLIEKTFKNFGISINVIKVNIGPVITRFEIKLPIGVKGNKIVSLSKDIARSLCLESVRIIESIPGKNCMGIELPNKYPENIYLSEIFNSKISIYESSILSVGIGKDIIGNPVYLDIAKMPHILIAGSTGSGKSSTIHSIIISLIYKNTPKNLRIILIDPKILEFSVYNNIPNLLCPVITDKKYACYALKWIINEMQRRYSLMSKYNIRNLTDYNNKINFIINKKKNNSLFCLNENQILPYIVIIIDELYDLIISSGKEFENLIIKIAQKSRASGIHLILSTQRPSVNVVTGLIKANIPARIAFHVSSKIDSHIIINQSGAELLLGRGDMLYLPPDSHQTIRIHGAFISEQEIYNVTQEIKKNNKSNYIDIFKNINNKQ